MANVTLGEARDTLAFAELEASSEEGPPEAEEIGQAEPKQLPEYLERFGLVVQVDPGRGNLPERVSLLPE